MNQLAKQTQLDRDKAALVNPQSAQQVMEIADRSGRLYKALKGMKGYEAEYYKAFEVMIEAYRVVGRELAQMEDAKPGPKNYIPDGNTILSVKDLGITYKQSHEWQSLAVIPAVEVEEYINARRSEEEHPTKAALLEIAKNHKSADALATEEAHKTMVSLDVFCIRAKALIDHLRKYPDSRIAIPKEFFEHLKMLEDTVSDLNRAVL